MRWGLPVITMGVAITWLFAVPIWTYGNVPLASKALATAYVEAALRVKAAQDTEKTEGDSVLVPWEEALALDAALLRQDFGRIRPVEWPTHAEAVTLLFVEKHEEMIPCPTDPIDPSCQPRTRRWFTQYSLEAVMLRQGFSEETKTWARAMRENAHLVLAER